MSTTKKRRLLDEVRDVMRLHHYSIHTERTYCDWIKRFVLFHKMASREDLKNGEAKIEKFLTHLAIDENVSAFIILSSIISNTITSDAKHEKCRFLQRLQDNLQRLTGF